MLSLTVLGNRGPYAFPGCATSGYLLASERTKVLLDCGSGVFARLADRVDPAELGAVVLTHLHFDHMSDALTLVYYLKPRGVRLPLYLPATDDRIVSLLADTEAYEITDIRSCGALRVGDISLRFVPLAHAVPSFGVAAACGERIFYTGDTGLCGALCAEFAAADLVLADCAYLEDAPNNFHMRAPDAARLASECGVPLLLTHFSARDIAAYERYGACAEEGMTYRAVRRG